eukprot:GILI01015336.1.p1 GENE.GILI01015336.1~~GILI01015336.1.p1  ORF type:complete len:339 (-),score=59.86 GILI01015336.1:109-1125(-)
MQLVCDTKYRLSAPTVDPSTGIVYALCRQSGAVLAIEPESGNNCTRIGDSNGQPTAIIVSPYLNNSNSAGPNDVFATNFLVADPNRQGIMSLERTGDAVSGEAGASAVRNGSDILSEVITSFEGKPLFGPNAVTVDPQGELIFADAGLPGDSGLSQRVGAVYRTINNRSQLTRLIKPSLACPSAIATSGDDGSVIYVAEMAENRVLRLVRLPDGAGFYYSSVFARMSGSMGPVSLAVHPTTKDLYVAMYDLDIITANNGAGASPQQRQGAGSEPGSQVLGTGQVHVFDALGELKGTIAVRGSQITGICFSANFKALYIAVDGGANGNSFLYSTPVADN